MWELARAWLDCVFSVEVDEKGVLCAMGSRVFPTRNRVRITSYGPFRGLEGTIQLVDAIVDEQEEPFCFFLIKLVGASIPQPVWFECQEGELIEAPAVLAPAPELPGAAFAGADPLSEAHPLERRAQS